jgi:hypothetical protein
MAITGFFGLQEAIKRKITENTPKQRNLSSSSEKAPHFTG